MTTSIHPDEDPREVAGTVLPDVPRVPARCDHSTGRHTTWEFARYCGARVCWVCNDHQGLARCFCGWSQSGADGLRELIEMGEIIEGE